mmetsp:Transcript_5017/g.10965  ORF Transcript_5017/g.10965 Transcript_5017/m.10965 type:complete len:309 (-) Transcript_5017:124-1050(-)|eukprot:CAMPEP_0178498898 /NCGR_PEP_ID=MMETSP0696-20121128/15519_1 /TAXON_ID=265572 /ORGANISM="Extubocellulus spinifer, Strain CCMP396" /LENGTH=308 /DNA_ID=CAMNT_0020127525 /DNA_START=154 /DNA_END=1080 /DNA_ORIENTATION=+
MVDPSNKRSRSPRDDAHPSKLVKSKDGDKASAAGCWDEEQTRSKLQNAASESSSSSSTLVFPKASPATMEGRRVWKRLGIHLRVADDDDDDDDDADDVDADAGGEDVDDQKVSTNNDAFVNSAVRFKLRVHVYKQKKRTNDMFNGYADKGYCDLKYYEDGTIICREPTKLSAMVNAKVPTVQFDPYERLIGPSKRKTKYPALFVMLKNHSVISEGELRAYYLVFDYPCDMALFLLNFLKDCKSFGDETTSVGAGSEDDLETSFESQNSELSDLFPESEDVFADNAIDISDAPKFKGCHAPNMKRVMED